VSPATRPFDHATDEHIVQRRPAGRAVPGHREGDIIFRTGHSAIPTLAGRRSRFVMLACLPRGHGAEAVTDALSQAVTTLPAQLRRSLTWDQGKEMAEHVQSCSACACSTGEVPHRFQRGYAE
jgi:transposase, IS30 family